MYKRKSLDVGALRYVGYLCGSKRMKILYHVSNCSTSWKKLVLEYDWIPEGGWHSDDYLMDTCLAPGNNLFDQNIWQCDDVSREAEI